MALFVVSPEQVAGVEEQTQKDWAAGKLRNMFFAEYDEDLNHDLHKLQSSQDALILEDHSEKFEDLADRFSEAKRRKIAIDDREAELIMVEEQVVVGGVKQVPPPRNFSF